MADEIFDNFELIPADYPDLDPSDELQAVNDAVDGINTGDSLADTTAVQERPFGRTWMFDHETGRLVNYGGSPAVVTAERSVVEWAHMAIRTERLAYPIFTDEFGMDAPDRQIGFMDATERQSQYTSDLKAALLVHDRITDVRDFVFTDIEPEVLGMTATLVIDGELELRVDSVIA